MGHSMYVVRLNKYGVLYLMLEKNKVTLLDSCTYHIGEQQRHRRDFASA